MTVVFLSSPWQRTRERRYYADSFDRAGHSVVEWVPKGVTGVGLAQMLLGLDSEVLVLHPEQEPVFPRDLLRVTARTACFQIDTFKNTERRIEWSKAFDHAFVFHPGFDSLFSHAGHPSATLLPHAIDGPLFKRLALRPRIFEVGWVGRVDGSTHSRRRRLLGKVSEWFTTNPWTRSYSEDEVPSVYAQSKIVVNIPRDDWPQDANLRAFEAMGAGALLICPLPSELVDLGFVPGKHFLAYRDESELRPLITEALEDVETRTLIAEAGRDLVLREHTYDRRVETILRTVRSGANGVLQRVHGEGPAFDGLLLDYCIGHHKWAEALRLGLRLSLKSPSQVARIGLSAARRRLRLPKILHS